ncbi:MAG TPA: efflux RND transporter periplasmic adaptor subunit [Phycisphaerae bacterium]|nr:efflux RND transporter periplasmic adaptor subunit [Phycisphaerae bacterium]
MKRWVKMLRTVAVVVVCGAVVVLLLLWLAGSFHEKIAPGELAKPRILLGGAATVLCNAADVSVVDSAVGSIEAVRATEVSAKILARIKAINVAAGQAVKANDVLVVLDDADLAARLEQAAAARDAAKAALDQAQVDSERIKRLLESAAATEREATTAENNLRAAQARYEQASQAVTEAQTVLDYAVIRSPMDGIVIDKLAEAGDMAKPGQPLVKLFDRLQLVATVRESLAERLKVGEDLTVHVEALNKSCQGRVSEIVPEADPMSRSFQVKVVGPCAPGIIPGMFGRLEIPLGQRRELRVPASTVMNVGQLEMVLVVEDGHIRRQFVRTGARSVDSESGKEVMQILSGLSPEQSWRLVTDATSFWAGVEQ